MSGTFYTQVSRLFHLLDLDGNHRIDREEVRSEEYIQAYEREEREGKNQYQISARMFEMA